MTFGHSAMIPENPALSRWDVSSGRAAFDLPPSAMGREANHGIPDPGAGTAGLAVAFEYVARATAMRLPAGVCRRQLKPCGSRHSPDSSRPTDRAVS